MDKKKIPYAVRVSAALLAGKTDEAFNVIGEALTDIVGKISKVSQDYCYIDLPFVIAALRVAHESVREEIADVYIMLVQLVEIVGKPEEVQQIVLEKLEQLKGDLDGGEVQSE